MVQKNDEKLFSYVCVRVLQNYLETWYNIAQQAATWMVPTLMCVLSLQRSLSFAYVTNSEFDFTSTGKRQQKKTKVIREVACKSLEKERVETKGMIIGRGGIIIQ